MITADAPFHELKGIGPATETRLHEAGIRTWAAMAEALDAFARVRDIDAPRLRALRDEARDRVDEPVSGVGADGEQTFRFILVVTAQQDGHVARTNLTDVRSETARSFAGLSGNDIVHFVEQRIRSRSSDPEALEPSDDARSSTSVAAAEFDRSAAIRFAASTAARDIVVVDAGIAIGAGERSIALRWDTSDVDAGDADEFRYRAVLAGRPYGGADVAGWRSLGSLTGTTRPGEMVDLDFETTELASGITRLELTIEVEPTPIEPPDAKRRRVAAGTPGG